MKKGMTFVVKIIDQQHETWQGNLTWIEEHKECKFRSALELIKLMDEVVGNQKSGGGDVEE